MMEFKNMKYIGICLLDAIGASYAPKGARGIVPYVIFPIVFLAYVLHNI